MDMIRWRFGILMFLIIFSDIIYFPQMSITKQMIKTFFQVYQPKTLSKLLAKNFSSFLFGLFLWMVLELYTLFYTSCYYELLYYYENIPLSIFCQKLDRNYTYFEYMSFSLS